MKSLAIIGSLVAVFGLTNAFIGHGPCPANRSSIPFEADMVTGNPLYFQQVDTLIFNGLTLYGLFTNYNISTPFCQIAGPNPNNFVNQTYQTIVQGYFNGSEYPVFGRFSLFNSTTNTWIVQGCVDASVLQNNTLIAKYIPSSLNWVWGMALSFMNTMHYEATVVLSETQNLSADDNMAINMYLNSTDGGNIPNYVMSPMLTNMTGCNIPFVPLVGMIF